MRRTGTVFPVFATLGQQIEGQEPGLSRFCQFPSPESIAHSSGILSELDHPARELFTKALGWPLPSVFHFLDSYLAGEGEEPTGRRHEWALPATPAGRR